MLEVVVIGRHRHLWKCSFVINANTCLHSQRYPMTTFKHSQKGSFHFFLIRNSTTINILLWIITLDRGDIRISRLMHSDFSSLIALQEYKNCYNTVIVITIIVARSDPSKNSTKTLISMTTSGPSNCGC